MLIICLRERNVLKNLSHRSIYERWLSSDADWYSNLYPSASERCLGWNYIQPRHHITISTTQLIYILFENELAVRDLVISGCKLGCRSFASVLNTDVNWANIIASGRKYMRPRRKLKIWRNKRILLRDIFVIAGQDDNSSRPASRVTIRAHRKSTGLGHPWCPSPKHLGSNKKEKTLLFKVKRSKCICLWKVTQLTANRFKKRFASNRLKAGFRRSEPVY